MRTASTVRTVSAVSHRRAFVLLEVVLSLGLLVLGMTVIGAQVHEAFNTSVNTALTMRLLLWMMRHEGWSYDIDVFDENAVTNDPEDPWSANCAIPELLFQSSTEFESKVPGYSVTLMVCASTG